MDLIQAFKFIILLVLSSSALGNETDAITNKHPTNTTSKQLLITERINFIPRDYVRFEDSYYKYHQDPQTWNEARQICEAEGAYLIIINSEEEAQFLLRLMNQYPDAVIDDKSCDKHDVFVGFHDLFQEGQYVTIDGKSIRSSGYVHWEPDQPDNWQGNENCGTFSRYPSSGLNDRFCNCPLTYVCEIPLKSC
ncbi:hemolymph lipopolysaccharide-binding protein-like [Chrysoperla carnea]|uniref:hemolymph lipopolysaccharide-binding protein-like n=1 Tax=Chrysoperla carnea TaxID=189513 RepID=UPI001D06DF5B|nr:hemolymph lipopolysaccharide-binding protein-like [Chrysoperla carnea]